MCNQPLKPIIENDPMDALSQLSGIENDPMELLNQLNEETTQAIDQLNRTITERQNPKDEIINFTTKAITVSLHVCTIPGDEYKAITVTKDGQELELTPSEAIDLHTNLSCALQALIQECD